MNFDVCVCVCVHKNKGYKEIFQNINNGSKRLIYCDFNFILCISSNFHVFYREK